MRLRLLRFMPLLLSLAAPLGCAAETPTGFATTSDVAVVRFFKRERIDGALLGGLSGIAFDAASKRLVAVSDADKAFSLPVGDADAPEFLGQLSKPKKARDAEAIRRAPGGGWIVAFERGGAYAFYQGSPEALTTPATEVSYRAELKAFPYNAATEALALIDFNRVLAIAEGGDGDKRAAWIFDGDQATERAYVTLNGLDPVDAVELPNGDLLVLERRFNGFLPPFFTSALARIDARDLASDAKALAVTGRLDLSPHLPTENWEGIEVGMYEGAPVVWLVSDDNFRWPQNTLLARLPLEFVLSETGGP